MQDKFNQRCLVWFFHMLENREEGNKNNKQALLPLEGIFAQRSNYQISQEYWKLEIMGEMNCCE